MRAIIQSSSLSYTVCAAKDLTSWHLAGETSKLPSFGLVGLLKPKVVVSPRVLDALTPEQFQAALEHERAHRSSGDNLKRLLILLTPDLVPFLRSFRVLEDHWDQYAELAADDFATRGNPDRSIALAEALIRLARLEGNLAQPPLVSGLFAAREGLAVRVERLLRLHPVAEQNTRFQTLFWLTPSLFLVGSVLVFPHLQVFHGVYRLLESLLR
jgi:Zn-dependent protease with chaperone function